MRAAAVGLPLGTDIWRTLRKAFSKVADSSEVFGFTFVGHMIPFLRFEGRD